MKHKVETFSDVYMNITDKDVNSEFPLLQL